MKLTTVLLLIMLTLAACVPTPTPPPPTETPTVTPVPPPPTWLLECKQSKCPVFISVGDNDSGAPMVVINSGTLYTLGDRLQFYYPCVIADGGDTACEIYRDADGNVYPRDRYIWRDQLSRVY